MGIMTFPGRVRDWPTIKKLIWLKGIGAAGGAKYETVGPDSIVTFNTVRSAPLRSLLVTLTPQQNLNGYSNPWPAGGGKNKWVPCSDQTVGNVTFTWQADGSVKLNGLCNSSAVATVSATLPSGTYTLSCGYSGSMPNNGSSRAQVYNSQWYYYIKNNDASNASVTFTLAESATVEFRFRVDNGFNYQNVIYYPQLEMSETPTSFSPYSNICPISGASSLDVVRTGKNLLNPQAYTGAGYNSDIGTQYTLVESTATVNGNTITFDIGGWGARAFRTENLPAGDYIFHFDISAITSPRVSIYVMNADNTVSAKNNFSSGTTAELKKTLTDGQYILANIGSNTAQTITVTDWMVEKGDSYTGWADYSGTSIPITIPTPPGTVYGGTLDVVTGVLTVMWARDLIKNLSWTYQSAQTRFYTASISNSVKKPLNNGDIAEFLCECFKTTDYNSYQDMNISVATSGNIFLKCSTYTDKDSFVSALGDCAITYALATPQTYQLTAQEVQTLVGTNNVWCDALGSTVTVEYRSN